MCGSYTLVLAAHFDGTILQWLHFVLDHSFKDIEQSDRIIVAQESVVIKVFVESIVD